MAKVTGKEAATAAKLREARRASSKKKATNSNKWYKSLWFRYSMLAIISAIMLQFVDFSSSDSKGSKKQVDSTTSSASSGGKKKREYISRELWEQQMRNKETPTGEPRDLYPKYAKLFSEGATIDPEAYLFQKLHMLGRAYSIAESETEKQNQLDLGNSSSQAAIVDIGVNTYIRYGSKVLTDLEQQFAYIIEVIRRDPSVGKVDLTQTLFAAIDSVYHNLHVVQTGMLGKIDDVDYEAEDDNEGGEPSRRGHQIGMISKVRCLFSFFLLVGSSCTFPPKSMTNMFTCANSRILTSRIIIVTRAAHRRALPFEPRRL